MIDSITFIPLPKQAKDITNQRFGRLVALGPVGRNNKAFEWLCQCDCGNSTVASIRRLGDGRTRSCGCLRDESRRTATRTHGMAGQSIYAIWRAMVQRCTNPNNDGYRYYGARGITVCDEWRDSFEAYHDYVSRLPNYDKKGYTLDRIDNSLGYQPGNVRYVTMADQGRNRRSNIVLTHNGRTQVLSDWADELQISRGILQWRIHADWSVERALTTPPRSQNHSKRRPRPTHKSGSKQRQHQP